MITVSLDVHTKSSQLVAMNQEGEIFIEMKVPTKGEELRRTIEGIKGRKRVVFEEGPLSGMIHDALVDVVDDIISCDSTRNALISSSEKKSDESDARWLARLTRLHVVNPVYIPCEPYRTLRSILMHDYHLMKKVTGVKNRIKAMCRRNGISYRGTSAYVGKNRPNILKSLPNATLRWQMEGLYREYDMLRVERVGAHRVLSVLCRDILEVALLQSIPGVGSIVARTLVGWIVDPSRFPTKSKLVSYSGLGLGQGWTNWKPLSPARASKRGQRVVKRVLFLAANGAIKGDNALARRYNERIKAGWSHRKAIRDIARKILFIAASIMKQGCEYNDDLVNSKFNAGQINK